MSSSVEATIFEMLAGVEPGKSIAPEQVARSVDAESWRRLLPQVRSTAIGLARQGKLVITRHGKPADPNRFKGVYRLRAFLESDVIPVSDADAEPEAGVDIDEA